jgi:tetratricopeptide (TPR) repeat protein
LQIRRDLKADAALDLAQAAVEWAQWAADPVTQLLAAFARGAVLFLAASLSMLPPGDYDQIRESLEQSIAFGRQIPATDSLNKSRARVMEVLSQNILGNFFSLRGERAEARRCYDEALAICQTMENVFGEGQTCNSIGELLENEGSLEQALHFREQALRAYQQLNEPDSVSATLGNLCGVLTYLGDYPRALENGRKALHLRQGNGLAGHLLFHRVGVAAYYLGDVEQTLQLLAAALEESATSPHLYQFRLLAGECYTRQGRWEEAAEALRLALTLAQKGQNPMALMTIQRAQAELALAQGDMAAALAHVEALLPLLSGAPLPSSHEPLRLYWTCYRALQANSDPRAPGILSAAHALLQSQAALIQDAALHHTFLYQVAANRKIYQTSEV